MFNSEPSNKTFLVNSRARPRRIAFLLDPTDCPDELFDSLFYSNYVIWGGRLNPIIPVVSGEISDSYWELLRFCDPDIIYSYCDISGDVIRHLDHELCPLKMIRHRTLGPADRAQYAPSVCREQVDISSLYPIILRRKTFGRRRPRVLTSTTSSDWADRRFVLRNFGLFEERDSFKLFPEDQEKMTIDDSWNAEKLLFELSRRGSPIVFPFQAAAAFAEHPVPDEDYRFEYCLIIGDDAQAWIYFWNRIFLLSDFHRSDWQSLCIPIQAFESQAFRDTLRAFLNKFVYRSGSSLPAVDLVSFVLSTEELDRIRIDSLSSVNAIFRPEKLTINEYPPIAAKRRSFPGFVQSGISMFEPDRTTRQQAAGCKNLLKIPESDLLSDRGAWMMDLRVEYVPIHHFYSNERLWWMLPRRRELANLFLPGRQARISSDFSISTEMGKESVFELSIPSESSVISSALGAGFQFCWSEGFKTDSIKPRYVHIKSSDKGDYTHGVLELFGGLLSAGGFFENVFWRKTVEHLSKRKTPDEAKELERIRNKLTKQREILANAASGEDRALSWLSRQVLLIARDQHMLDEDTSFFALNKHFHEQREEFMAKNPTFRKDSSEEGIRADRERATMDLRESLQSLTDARIYRQGVRLHCRNCGTNYWGEINEVRQQNHCHGCGATISLSVESPWRYRLNTLIRNAVAFHGLIPVILTLYELRHTHARHFFLFAPGVELYNADSGEGPSAELDIVSIMDGKLIIGEVKTNSEELNQSGIEKLADLAKSIEADAVVIGCYQDSKAHLNEIKVALEAILNRRPCKVLAILPHDQVFEPTPSPFF